MARDRSSCESGACVDETASKGGQTYFAVFDDLDAQRLLFATPGREKATLGDFASDLIAHVSMDMSGSFQAGAAEHFPEAEVYFDRFHVVALSSRAPDEVRRADLKSAPEPKGIRWSLYKKLADWNPSSASAGRSPSTSRAYSPDSRQVNTTVVSRQ
ncbi:transposase [Propionivibrio sp.]|uniref:transposase n=1 Tax=Propionivibrio sp. TaxID=2212460 RepID=UPI002609421D|nr:transposase [Propionivibrio sp.]